MPGRFLLPQVGLIRLHRCRPECPASPRRPSASYTFIDADPRGVVREKWPQAVRLGQ
jgi:hypothetical protein